MSIEQSNVIDFLGPGDSLDDVILFITDHLPWTGDTDFDHASLLQDKLNSHLAYIESGELENENPQYIGKNVIIRVLGKYPLNDDAEKFYNSAKKIICNAGFRLEFFHMP